MKKIFLIPVLFLFIAVISCEKEEDKFSLNDTTWDVSFEWEYGGSGSADITFNKDGTTTWGGTWTLNDKEVNWSWEWDGESEKVTTTYTGTATSDTEMSGTCTNTTDDSGTWSATRSSSGKIKENVSSQKTGGLS
ncbi:MAG: hypothetical protein ACLFVR_12385 [Thiohalospira sp.]